MNEEKVSAIILAGGIGQRLGSAETPKQFLEIHGKPIIEHTVDIFQGLEQLHEIVVVAPKASLRNCEELFADRSHETPVKIVSGGDTRMKSTLAGANACREADTVIIHNAVCPLTKPQLITECLAAARTGRPISAYVPEINSIVVHKDKIATRFIEKSTLARLQAPQVFNRKLLIKMHERSIKEEKSFNNDIEMATYYGEKSELVLGHYSNIKVTTSDDYLYALITLGSSR